MRRSLRGLIVSLGIGLLLGGYLGAFAFPQAAYRSPMSQLAPAHRDAYSVMAAAGFAVDGDALAALYRLSQLGVSDIPEYIADTTDRIIASAARDIRDIRLLVNLARGLGRVTPAMQPFIALGGDS